MRVKNIELGNSGKITVIDYEDYNKVKNFKWKFCKVGRGYEYGYAKATEQKDYHRTYISLSRLICGLDPNDRREVDHINRDTLDNRKSNLRICTRSENCINRSLFKAKRKNVYKGIVRMRDKWQSRITLDGKTFWLGTFDTPVDAALAYNQKAKKLFGEFADLNKIN